jgi:hypothetical protein
MARHSRTGHGLQRVVPDFQPERRLKVNDHGLKQVAWYRVGGGVPLKPAARWERLWP